MLVVHVHARVRRERVPDFLAATLVNAEESHKEPGVLRFDVIADQGDPAHVALVEVYRDDATAGRENDLDRAKRAQRERDLAYVMQDPHERRLGRSPKQGPARQLGQAGPAEQRAAGSCPDRCR